MKKGSALFQLGRFRMHSGIFSKWKIECDMLIDADYETLAWIVANEMKLKYSAVFPIPRGGDKFAVKLLKYRTDPSDPILIVDDVLTTGQSFMRMRDVLGWNAIGVVIFARGECPEWVHPIFRYNQREK